MTWVIYLLYNYMYRCSKFRSVNYHRHVGTCTWMKTLFMLNLNILCILIQGSPTVWTGLRFMGVLIYKCSLDWQRIKRVKLKIESKGLNWNYFLSVYPWDHHRLDVLVQYNSLSLAFVWGHMIDPWPRAYHWEQPMIAIPTQYKCCKYIIILSIGILFLVENI